MPSTGTATDLTVDGGSRVSVIERQTRNQKNCSLVCGKLIRGKLICGSVENEQTSLWVHGKLVQ